MRAHLREVADPPPGAGPRLLLGESPRPRLGDTRFEMEGQLGLQLLGTFRPPEPTLPAAAVLRPHSTVSGALSTCVTAAANRCQLATSLRSRCRPRAVSL